MATEVLVDINKLVGQESGSSYVEKIHHLPGSDLEDFILAKPITGLVELIRLEDEILVRFNLIAVFKLECSRCLNSFNYLAKIITSRQYPLAEHMIDLWPAIREEVILATPMKPLCDEKCKGIAYK